MTTHRSPVTLATEHVGASIRSDGVHYRIWAPAHSSLHVVISSEGGEKRRIQLANLDGHHGALDPLGRGGDRYWFELPNGDLLPDVASRFQPQGVHGPSEVIDPLLYRWSSMYWQRPSMRDLVIYELHIGTFSPTGTFLGAIDRLDHIVSTGATAIQLMPVADFPGRFNWGYDGVALFAPSHTYGRPDDLRALVDSAHARGLAAIIDVVYNHTGPEGSYLSRYAPDYFHHDKKNTWGTGYNVDGPASGPVRDFILQNVAYWLDEFRFDGLRADATHAIIDHGETHILADISRVAHQRGAFVIAEDERNPVELLHDAAGRGHGFDAVWSDDFHHSVRVALTGTQEAYFASYDGSTEELAKTLDRGWTYCGEAFPYWKGRPRGSECHHLSPSSFVVCIENHDQAGNRAHGERLSHLCPIDGYRAASALLCLSPYTPMLFMGQEWKASTPFLFFSDLSGECGRNVRAGRIEEFRKTGLNQDEKLLGTMPDPQAPSTFSASKLDWADLQEPQHAQTMALYQECLRWRRRYLQGLATERVHWKVIALREAVAIRYFPPDKPEWLLVVTLKGGAPVDFIGDLSPPETRHWITVFHTLETRFGGDCDPVINTRYFAEETLPLLCPAAVVLQASHAA